MPQIHILTECFGVIGVFGVSVSIMFCLYKLSAVLSTRDMKETISDYNSMPSEISTKV